MGCGAPADDRAENRPFNPTQKEPREEEIKVKDVHAGSRQQTVYERSKRKTKEKKAAKAREEEGGE